MALLTTFCVSEEDMDREIDGGGSCYTLIRNIRGLCLMKWPSETLQNLANFWNTKTHIVLVLRKNVGRKYKQKKKPCIFVFQKYEKIQSVSLV